MTKRNRTTKDLWKKYQVTTGIKAFIEAYHTLELEAYLPEKPREIVENFLKKAKIPSAKLPFDLRIMQVKIDIDSRMRRTVKEIYKLVDLKDYTE